MPLNRFQIRNEYSLADPELYKVADKDDPEALLEGVAMAGLVGVLRQLGDLAEFAAEIFHDLHEEVMATASRGHGLIVRVQQLEAEFPSIERTLLSQTSHTAFLYNSGIDWHPNPRMDQSVVTRGDLPRFVMDSYEECRGPPRLFLLDKFDVAGAGACLKRFTDPSFFKMESTLSNGRKLEGQREKKTRRVKKRGPRWRNGDTPESFPSSHAKLHQLFLEERIESGINDPARRVKLKKRQFTGSMFDQDNVKSYMEKFLDTSPQEQKILHEICVDPLALTWTSNDVGEAGLEIVEIGTISPVKESMQTDGSLCSSPDAREMVVKPSMEDIYQGRNLTNDNEYVEVPGLYHESHDGSISTVSKALSGEEIIDKDSKSEVSVNDAGSEIDNYVDALANIESEVETDTEYKENPRYLNWKPFVTDSDGSERRRELHSVSLDSQSVGNSVISEDGDNFSKDRDISSCSNSVNTLNETSRDQEDAVMDVPTIQASNSDSDNLSFDHNCTSDDIVREESQKHAAALTVHAEVVNILKNEQESGEASNTSVLADFKEVVMPADLEDSLKNTDMPDLESEDSTKGDSILERQENTNHISYSPSHITYPDTSDGCGHYLSEPSNHDKEGQNSNVYSGTSCDTSNISDGLGNLLETDSHNSACSSVEEHEKLLGMAVDACPDSGSPSKHLPISDPVNLEKTKLIDVAFEEGIYIPSTQENSKDLFCISDSSASFGMPELLPVTTDPVHVPSLDLAANSCSWQEPSLEDNIALSEESVFSTHVVQTTTNSAIPNQLHICAQEFSSSEITEAVELTECDSLEADSAVAPSRDESNCGNSRSADGIIVNDSVTVEKHSPMLEIQETQHEWLRIPSGSTDTATLDLCEDVACIQDSRNDTCTGCFPFDGSNEDKADAGFLEREPESEDFASIYSNQTKVAEPEILVDDPAPQAAPMHGEHLVDRAPSDHHVDMEKIFSNDTSPLDKPTKHANDSDYVTTAENDSDLDHDTEKVKHIETVADGPEQVDVKDDSQENMITLSSSLSLHPENLQERPILVSEEFQRYDELAEEHRGEFTEIRKIYPVGDISVTSISNELSSDDSPSSLDGLQPEDVKTSGKIAEEAPLASDDRSEHIESSSSLQIPKHLNSLSHDLITPCYVERDESAGTAALHCDDQQTESKAAPQLSEHVLDTSDVVFHGNSMQNDAYKATQVEKSEQPLSQQGFPDLRMRPTGPQINLEPPSLPPLPPMQWRLGRFQNSAAAAPVERRMMQHTLVPAQVQPMSLPTIRHNLAPVQPMTLPAMHHTLASFQPVPLTAGNSTFAAIPPATLPTTLPAVHYTFTPLRPVTLPTSDYGTETFAQTSTSDGQLGYSNGYMTQQGVFTLPMQVGVSDGFFQFNSNAVGRQDNILSAVPLTSTNLNGYVTQQGIFPPSMPVMVSEGSSQTITSGVGGQNNVPFIASLSSTRPLEGISEEFCQAHSELNSLIEDHSSEHTSALEAKVNFDTANQNELLRHSSQVLEEEAPNSYVQSILASAVDQPPPGLVAPDAGRTWLSDYDGISTHADDTTNGTLQKKPPRPRNPLIDEVVAIDKSKLRKVERVKPPLESKLEEGESLREQMQLRKVERVKLPMESKVEGENLIEQLQLRKVERVKPPVEQKAEEKEFLLEQLQLRKVSERVKPPVEQKSEGMEFSLEQLQLRKVREKPKQEVQPKVEEIEAPPQAQLRKVSERFREEVELKVEETESPRVQLRKVPERENPLVAQNTEERDSLFEQIRNKSFNLKPAVAARPNIQGPRTNLKVAAILEKASNIRQAMAGSDEDDDADSWSDDS